jgi:hypothetical protein
MRSETVSTIDGPNRRRQASARTVAVGLVIGLMIVAFFSAPSTTQAQTTTEFWPSVKAHFDVRPRIGLEIYGERQNGEELPSPDLKAGFKVSFRVKPLFKPLAGDLNPENQYLANMAVGYEYLRKSKNGQPAIENRLILESTPRYAPGAGFLFLNRNRMEFRWNDGTYDFRYRFKVTGQRAFKIDRFHFTPYGSGELFWDRNKHSWNENQYALGVHLPIRRRFMIDTYVPHQNCTTCGQRSVNAFGLTANIYLGKRK